MEIFELMCEDQGPNERGTSEEVRANEEVGSNRSQSTNGSMKGGLGVGWSLLRYPDPGQPINKGNVYGPVILKLVER